MALVAVVCCAGATLAADASAADTPRKTKPHSKGPSPTTASPAPSNSASKTRAAELYKKSAEAYLQGDFDAAIKLLDEAYAIDPQPVLVYNQARAHEGLGHLDEAISLYEKYLQQDPASPDRGAIEQRVSTLKKQKEEKERVDKEKASVEAQRAQQHEQQLVLEQRERELSKPPPKTRSILPYLVAGVGAAGIATGTVFGFLALREEKSGNRSSNLRDATEAQGTGRTFAMVSNISFIAGGVLFAGGVVWWLFDGGTGGSKTTGTARRPLQLGGSF
jgi:tetratricopeptide (TPR) repeat protein